MYVSGITGAPQMDLKNMITVMGKMEERIVE
jgi:hypothetical protein